MQGVKVGGVALVTVATMGLAAMPALASPGVSVGSLSSLKAGARAGMLRGELSNASAHAVKAHVSVRIQRTGAAAKFVGHAAVRVPARGTARYRVAVKARAPGAAATTIRRLRAAGRRRPELRDL